MPGQPVLVAVHHATVTGLTLALLSTAALSYGFYLQHSAPGHLPPWRYGIRSGR